MSFIERFLSILTPYECLNCSAEGDLLCVACTQQLTIVPERCFNCLKISRGSLTCAHCEPLFKLSRVRAAAAYSGLAKILVAKLKFTGAQGAARQMASLMLPLLPENPDLVIVPVPTATDRVRGRGYDQAKLLARELGRQTRLPYIHCLARSGHTRQIGAARQQRLLQLQGAFRVTKTDKIHGRHILLVDDVATTGATLETTARIIYEAGAKRVEALVFAQA